MELQDKRIGTTKMQNGKRIIAAYFETSIENLISEKTEPTQKKEVGFDDFTYAFFQETKNLSDEAKEQLLTMAKLLNGTLPKKKE